MTDTTDGHQPPPRLTVGYSDDGVVLYRVDHCGDGRLQPPTRPQIQPIFLSCRLTSSGKPPEEGSSRSPRSARSER
jgi:hypothetical protein